MTNKDEQLIYEELTALCRKQEGYIKELEDKIYGTLSDTEKDTEKCESFKPDYDELCRQVQSLNNKIFKLKEESEALRYSLTEMHMKLKASQSREETWEEYYYEECERANKLFEELEKLKND